MPLIRISDEAYKDLIEFKDSGLTRQLHRQGYNTGTISKTASALIEKAINTERLRASLESSKL